MHHTTPCHGAPLPAESAASRGRGVRGTAQTRWWPCRMLARQRGLQHISQDIRDRGERAAQARKAALKQGAPTRHRQTPQEREAFLGKLAKYNAVRAMHK